MPAAGERRGGSGSAARACTSLYGGRRMTIEGASFTAGHYGHDKNKQLLGFATTDEIGSVMDMTKRIFSETGRGPKTGMTHSRRRDDRG